MIAGNRPVSLCTHPLLLGPGSVLVQRPDLSVQHVGRDDALHLANANLQQGIVTAVLWVFGADRPRQRHDGHHQLCMVKHKSEEQYTQYCIVFYETRLRDEFAAKCITLAEAAARKGLS